MLTSVMNDAKWNELRLEMMAIEPRPAWSMVSTNGYRSPPDREWFYHFSEGGFEPILHLDIQVETFAQRNLACGFAEGACAGRGNVERLSHIRLSAGLPDCRFL